MHANRTATRVAPSLAFTRPSRHDGPSHIVRVDDITLRPLSCSCEAGRHGRLCWAVISVAASDLEPLAQKRWVGAKGVDEITAAAHVVTMVRRWANAARELQALRPCGYTVTDRGLEAIAS